MRTSALGAKAKEAASCRAPSPWHCLEAWVPDEECDSKIAQASHSAATEMWPLEQPQRSNDSGSCVEQSIGADNGSINQNRRAAREALQNPVLPQEEAECRRPKAYIASSSH